ESGDRGHVSEVDCPRRQSVAGQINIIRARPANAADPTAATARADRAKIENVQRTIRCVRGNGVEGDQPSCENNQNSFQVLHEESAVLCDSKLQLPDSHFVVGLKISCEKL